MSHTLILFPVCLIPTALSLSLSFSVFGPSLSFNSFYFFSRLAPSLSLFLSLSLLTLSLFISLSLSRALLSISLLTSFLFLSCSLIYLSRLSFSLFWSLCFCLFIPLSSMPPVINPVRMAQFMDNIIITRVRQTCEIREADMKARNKRDARKVFNDKLNSRRKPIKNQKEEKEKKRSNGWKEGKKVREFRHFLFFCSVSLYRWTCLSAWRAEPD